MQFAFVDGLLSRDASYFDRFCQIHRSIVLRHVRSAVPKHHLRDFQAVFVTESCRCGVSQPVGRQRAIPRSSHAAATECPYQRRLILKSRFDGFAVR